MTARPEAAEPESPSIGAFVSQRRDRPTGPLLCVTARGALHSEDTAGPTKMLFSDAFNVERDAQDDWFDPILGSDTLLFIDPFLIFKEPSSSRWAGSHAKIIEYFDRCFRLIAEANCTPTALAYKKALSLLEFPEPQELCLGFTRTGTKGAGGGKGYARSIATAMVGAIQRGVLHLQHFEELGIFNEGIGADRISDITSTILKSDLVEYTQGICRRHGIPVSTFRLNGMVLDQTRLRLAPSTVDLPTNPKTGRPVILVPARFLRDLPQINDHDWWDFNENEELRTDLNYEIMGRVNKATIVAAARRHPERVAQYLAEKEREAPDPYDFSADPDGLHGWYAAARGFTSHNPIALSQAENEAGFIAAIEMVLEQFRLFVEEKGGWRLLWNDDKGTQKKEVAAQLLLRGIAENYCRSAGIVVDREVELGRGPVDFKFSNGFERRALVEIKKLNNGKFWNGLERQLPSYMTSDECKVGWFLVVQYDSSANSLARLAEIPTRLDKARASLGREVMLRSFVVDASRKVSASKVTDDDEE
jgi:hypothetical protein